MNVFVLSVLLFGVVTPASEAPPAASFDITKLTCKDLREASPLDRPAVVMLKKTAGASGLFI